MIEQGADSRALLRLSKMPVAVKIRMTREGIYTDAETWFLFMSS